MLSFACKDTGVDCDFIALGETAEEVKTAAFAHAQVVHKDLLASLTPEQLQGLEQAVAENTRPVS